MNYNQSPGHLAELLVEDLLAKIHQYDETMYLPMVLGCLELVKQQLIAEHMENNDDER